MDLKPLSFQLIALEAKLQQQEETASSNSETIEWKGSRDTEMTFLTAIPSFSEL